nr:MAG TPA: hypothetical protein [Caudoviricetes sp.]
MVLEGRNLVKQRPRRRPRLETLPPRQKLRRPLRILLPLH